MLSKNQRLGRERRGVLFNDESISRGFSVNDKCLLRFPNFIGTGIAFLLTKNGFDIFFIRKRRKTRPRKCYSFLHLLNRSIRSMSLASSIVALFLSADSLMTLLPLWVVGRERFARRSQRLNFYKQFISIELKDVLHAQAWQKNGKDNLKKSERERKRNEKK